MLITPTIVGGASPACTYIRHKLETVLIVIQCHHNLHYYYYYIPT